jgi:hypothetical protein
MLSVDEHRRRAQGVVGEHEHQGGDAELGGGVVLQFGVGHLGLVADGGAVAEPGDHHDHVRAGNGVAAYLGGGEVAGGEIGHVHHRVTRPRHRRLRGRGRGRHKRFTDRKLTQLRGVRQKHPPRRHPISSPHAPQHPRPTRTRRPADHRPSRRDVLPINIRKLDDLDPRTSGCAADERSRPSVESIVESAPALSWCVSALGVVGGAISAGRARWAVGRHSRNA